MSDFVNPSWPETTVKSSSYLKGRIGWQGLRASEFTDDGPYLITGTDFQGGKIDWSDCYHVTEARFREGAYIHVRNGDLLITKDGTIGKVAYVTDCPEKAVLNSGIFLLRCTDGTYDHQFLYHLLNSPVFDKFLRLNLAGSTINHLYQNVFERFQFPIPDIKLQRRIAEILSTLDEAIEQTEALIAKMQQVKAGLMHDLFTRGVTLDGRLRPTREQAPELYKESPLGWIPKEWEVKPIAAIAESLVDGPFGSNLKSEHYVIEPGVRVVRLQNIQEGYYSDLDPAYISQRHAEYLARNEVIPGDVLIAALGDETYPVGRACCYPTDLPSAINKADCFRLRCLPGLARNAFVMHSLNTVYSRAQVRRFEQGVTRRRINLGNLRRVTLVLPDIGEQDEIVQQFAAANEQAEIAEIQVEKLRQQKHGLMHDLLTGSVLVGQSESILPKLTGS